MNNKQVAQELIKLAKEITGADKPIAQVNIEKAISSLSYTPVEYAFPDRRMGVEAKKRLDMVVKELESILQEIPTPVIYMVVGIDNKTKEFDDVKDLIKYLKSKGYDQRGYETRGQLREMLQGQPMFDDLHGPVYGGPKKVRYETFEVYEHLSV